MNNDELDIDNFDVPILSVKGVPVKRANKSFKPLITAIERMQLTLFEIKYKAMAEQDKDTVDENS